jgi:nitrogenase molybdenum-cofactor synthesis protein NifE
MTNERTDALPLSQLLPDPGRVLGTAASDSTLHYCSPAHGGWGVVRAALLVPETYLLFACPAACGRHGAIAAIEQGYKERVGYLCLTEDELVMGGYEEEIVNGVRETIKRVKPKALILCVSCIDDLLGTDHEMSIAGMEREHGIPVRLARMNPISLDGKLPPPLRIQKTMYEFLVPPTVKDRSVIVLGAFVPPSNESELALFVAAAGFGPLTHPAFCRTFEKFSTLSAASAALVIRPEGTAAAELVERKLRIPAITAPVCYSRERIAERYRIIADALMAIGGEDPDVGGFLSPLAAETEDLADRVASVAGKMRIAIDASATASPYDLALALHESGFNVTHIYAERMPLYESKSFAALAEKKPGISIINPTHSRRASGIPDMPLADVAIGFAAGYATGAPVIVPVAFDEARYGFEGFRSVLTEIEKAILANMTKDGSGLKESIRSYGLVV